MLTTHASLCQPTALSRMPWGGAIYIILGFHRAGGMEGRTLTTAEWIKGIFAQGMVYTRLFDERLGVSQKAKSIAAKVCWFALHLEHR